MTGNHGPQRLPFTIGKMRRELLKKRVWAHLKYWCGVRGQLEVGTMIRAAHSTCGFTLFASFDFDLYAWAAASEEERAISATT